MAAKADASTDTTSSTGNETAPRNHAIDLLRATMVLYIVGWWHLLGHVGNGVAHINWITDTLTNVVLGSFTFLSGYGLGLWKGSVDGASLARFFKRRFLRVYPLYLLALGAFVAVWLADPHTAIKAAFLISMFVPQPPMTLWFITMIMVFYLVAPWLASSGLGKMVGMAATMWLALLGFNSLIHGIDPRIVMFFPAFVAGMVWRRLDRSPTALHAATWLAAAIGLGLAMRWKPADPLLAACASIPVVVTGSVAAMLVAGRWFNACGAWKIVQFLSFTSFSAYLFHRVVFVLVLRVLKPGSEAGQLLALLGVGLPVTIATAWLVQSLYDRLGVMADR